MVFSTLTGWAVNEDASSFALDMLVNALMDWIFLESSDLNLDRLPPH